MVEAPPQVYLERHFMEKSRRKKPGNVKVVENYIRDDVHCGIERCVPCARGGIPPIQPCLSASAPFYVIPDAMALVTYVDLFDDATFPSQYVILLQTVVDRALEIASTREAARMEAWLNRTEGSTSQAKTFVYFPNRHMRATFVSTLLEQRDNTREKEEHHHDATDHVGQESFVARDRRAYWKAVEWYAGHIHSNNNNNNNNHHHRQHQIAKTVLVLLSDDKDKCCLHTTALPPQSQIVSCSSSTTSPSSSINGSDTSNVTSTSANIQMFSCLDFVAAFATDEHKPRLMALIHECAHAMKERQQQQKQRHVPHVSPGMLRQMEDVYEGILDVREHYPLEAFVNINTKSSSSSPLPPMRVFIFGRDSMNRAIHGDRVAVQMCPRNEWRIPESQTKLIHHIPHEVTADNQRRQQQGNDENTVHDDAHKALAAAAIPTARVVAVLERTSRVVYHI
jgi:hypothetical protein